MEDTAKIHDVHHDLYVHKGNRMVHFIATRGNDLTGHRLDRNRHWRNDRCFCCMAWE